MRRITSQTERDQRLEFIAAQPHGVDIVAIASALGDNLKRRTLQRWLATLLAQGQIQIAGEAMAARYVRVSQGLAALQVPVSSVQAVGEVYVPTSP